MIYSYIMSLTNSQVQKLERLKIKYKIFPTDTEIVLRGKKIRPNGAKAIAKGLPMITALESLDLSLNLIQDEGAEAIANALKVNETVKHLSLDNNHIGVEGAKAIAKALEVNNTLEELVLSNNNNIGDEGAKAIAEALKNNTALKKLNLNFCWVSMEILKNITAENNIITGFNSTIKWYGIKNFYFQPKLKF